MSELEREARRLARPVLRALKRGKLSVDGLRHGCDWKKRGNRRHPVVRAFEQVLKGSPDYRIPQAGIEKDGIVLAGGVAFKIGFRAELEVQVYTVMTQARHLLAECVKLCDGVVAMERGETIDDLVSDAEVNGDDVSAIYDAADEAKSEMCDITCDAHGGNVARMKDGSYKLIDYSYEESF